MQLDMITKHAWRSPRQAPSSPKDGFYIPSLDGIRAAAVMLVFLAHAGLNEQVPGNFGVTVFFFLSGFLITTLLRIEFDKKGRISLKAFYLRRTLRILPPMYLVLGLASALVLVGALEGSLHLDAVLAQVFHLSNYYVVYAGWWDGRAPGTWIYWSLAVEEHFYLLFPLFYLLLRRFVPARRHQMLVLLGICAAVLAWRCGLVFLLDAWKERTYLATDTRVDSILFGCILAICGNPVLDRARVLGRWWTLFWLPLGVAGLLASFVIREPWFQETFRYTLQGLALFPVFVVAICYHDWGVFRLLNIGWVRFLGVLSYSLYLVHPTILFGLAQWTSWHPVARGALALGLSVLVSTAIYYFVEKPCAHLRKRLSRVDDQARHSPADHRSPSSATSTAATTSAVPIEAGSLPART
jgi:peptidoglycan/LPS O-acetylase OafA/YrhL